MAKSLLISEIFPPTNGGSGRWFWELYTRLPREEYYLAVGKCLGDTSFDSKHDLNLSRLNLSSSSWGVKSLRGLKFYCSTFLILKKIVKRENIKKFHCGRCLPEGVLGLIFRFLYNIPYICFIHGEDVEAASTSRELSWLVNKVLSNATKLISNSNNTKQLLIDNWHVDEEKIVVIHPGVDTDKFKPAPKNKFDLKTLGWHNKVVVLTVGRLQKRKGQDMMIKALPKIKEQIPNILYAIIGGGEEKQNLIDLVRQLNLENHVQFMAEVSDETMIKAYQQCDLFILPNRTEGKDIEGFGMVLVEAQACGKFVIAGDSGGTSETMMVGTTGIIIDCSTPENISISVLDMLSNNKYDFKNDSSDLIFKHFSWPSVISKFTLGL